MYFSYLNLLSALAIGLVIYGMAIVPSIRAKALLYVFPIPISIGIVATHGKISSSNLIGLMLIWVFLWLTNIFMYTFHMPIIAADTLAAIVYIVLGFVLNKSIHPSFLAVLLFFIITWTAYVAWCRKRPLPTKKASRSTVPPGIKGLLAAVISFGIYSVQHLLAGIVVTFPYNGIFAVVEAQHNLPTFNRSVIRNTIAIATLFTSMYYLQVHLALAVNLLIGWIAFGIIVFGVQKISV